MIDYMKSNRKLIIVIALSLISYVLSNGEWSIPVFAWIYPVLFLLAVHFFPSSKAYLIIFVIYAIGFIIRFVNVIGMDFWVCTVVAVLVAALCSLPYIFWQKSKRNFRATVIFAASMVIVEYVIYIIYPMLGGLSDAYTQYENSLLLQIVTVTGIYGISFIMYWTAANAKRKLSEIINELFIKTIKEAQADAKVMFWSELNGAVLKEEEAELLQRASDIANEQDIYLLVSLLVKTPYEDLKENKVVAFNPQGEQISEYYKFGRSIGELCIKGDGKLKSFDTEYGRIAPFICSDMAFSTEIRQAGKNDVDICCFRRSWKYTCSDQLF